MEATPKCSRLTSSELDSSEWSGASKSKPAAIAVRTNVPKEVEDARTATKSDEAANGVTDARAAPTTRPTAMPSATAKATTIKWTADATETAATTTIKAAIETKTRIATKYEDGYRDKNREGNYNRD
jgi:hypothetical protein